MGDKIEGQELDPKALEKSWADSMDALKKSLGDDSEGEETRGKLGKAKDPKVPPVEEETTDEEDEGDEPSMKKSLADRVADSDPDAEVAMDIEPYLKSLAEAIGDDIDELRGSVSKIGKLEKSMNQLTSLVKTLAKAVLADAEMQKSVKEDVARIGKIELPGMARLSKGGDRFQVEEGNELSYPEIMSKATELCQQGRITTGDVTVLESRLQRGGGIPEAMKSLFKKA